MSVEVVGGGVEGDALIRVVVGVVVRVRFFTVSEGLGCGVEEVRLIVAEGWGEGAGLELSMFVGVEVDVGRSVARLAGASRLAGSLSAVGVRVAGSDCGVRRAGSGDVLSLGLGAGFVVPREADLGELVFFGLTVFGELVEWLGLRLLDPAW